MSTQMNVPLLEADSSDEDIERGALPDYAQAQSAQRVGVGFLAGQKPAIRHGKDPVSLGDVPVRMGILFTIISFLFDFLAFLRKVLGILSFQFGVTVILCTALYLTPVVRGFVQQQ